MPQGSIVRLTDRGFGFISSGQGADIFFHANALVDIAFDNLREGQQVEYEISETERGMRAQNVRVTG